MRKQSTYSHISQKIRNNHNQYIKKHILSILIQQREWSNSAPAMLKKILLKQTKKQTLNRLRKIAIVSLTIKKATNTLIRVNNNIELNEINIRKLKLISRIIKTWHRIIQVL